MVWIEANPSIGRHLHKPCRLLHIHNLPTSAVYGGLAGCGVEGEGLGAAVFPAALAHVVPLILIIKATLPICHRIAITLKF